MSFLSRKTTMIALAAVFGVAAAGAIGYEQRANEGQRIDVCVDNLLIPQTLEQADYLNHHAAEAYAALDKKQDPKDSPLLAQSIADYRKAGKTVKVIGFDPNGSMSTLPDGTRRPVGCYILSVK